jgi:hypothetical protein
MTESGGTPPVMDNTGEAVTSRSVKEAIEELAGGAYFRWQSDGTNVLVRDLPQPEGGTVEVLLHRGWINGGNGLFRLTDAGLRAYLRSSDELGDGVLVHPHEWKVQP